MCSTLRTTGEQDSICCRGFTVTVRRVKVFIAFSMMITRLSVVSVITPLRFGILLFLNDGDDDDDDDDDDLINIITGTWN